MMTMTEQTARAEDEAAAAPAAASPSQPAPSTALEREHAEMRDRLLRTLAEMENLRKRTEREVADSRLYGVTSFARDILGGRRQYAPRLGSGGAGIARRAPKPA